MATEEGLATGELVAGRYRISGELGRGGMAIVYEARHVELDRAVALKVLRKELSRSETLRRRFLREARAAAKLEGDHVALVLDVGALGEGEDAVPYIAMERLRGKNLGKILEERGPLAPEEAVDFVLQACVGVAEAHARGIVHRDLKPANLFLATREEGAARIKVLDFGIAKAAFPEEVEGHASLTHTRDVFGTPDYMSPEQLRGSASVDARSDVWSLGVVLYELLSGKTPFAAPSVAEVTAAILERTPPRLGEVRSGLPEGLEDVVHRCLMKDEARRFAGVAGLAAALEPHGGAGASRWREAVERYGTAASERSTTPDLGPAPIDTVHTGVAEARAHTDVTWGTSALPVKSRARGFVVALLALAALVAAIVFFVQRGEAPAASTAPLEPPASETASVTTPPVPAPRPAPPPSASASATARPARPAPAPRPSAAAPPRGDTPHPGVPPPPPVALPPPSPYDKRE